MTRRCEVQDFDLTAHANREELLEFIGEVSPRAVVLGHGEPEAQQWFEDQIRTLHPKMIVHRPKPAESVIC